MALVSAQGCPKGRSFSLSKQGCDLTKNVPTCNQLDTNVRMTVGLN